MKKILLLIFFLFPYFAQGAVAVGWNATSTTQGWILPNYVNGRLPIPVAHQFIGSFFTATSSTATSIFNGLFRLPSLSQGIAFIGSNGLVSSTATTSASCSGTVSCSSFTVLGSSPITITGSGGSGGGLATTTPWTPGQLSYVVNDSTVTSVATGTISVPTGLTGTANRYVVGGNFTLGLDTGYVIPLQSTLDAKALGATTITVNGTANQITSSAGAQDLSTNRTWTLSLPNHVIFPSSYFATYGTTTNATSTNLGISNIYAIGSGGIDFHSNNGTSIATWGGGGGSNVTFYGGVNIDGTTRLATSLTGLLKASSGTVSTATAGTDYENPLTFSFPLIRTTNAISFGGLSTTTNLTTGHIPFVSGVNTFSSRATTSVSCTGTVSCTGFDVLGSSPITITGSGVTTALGTTSPWTTGQVAYVSSNSAVTSVATGTISVPTGLTATANRYVLGGNLAIGLDTGYVIPLQSTLDAKLASLGSGYATTTQNTIAFSTSTTAFNGLTFGQTIIPTAGALTFKPTITGTLDNAGLTNSTISGIALGSNLANLSATDSSLTFSGTYNGATARTIALNVGNANNWTALQTFLNASSTLFSAGRAYIGSSATTTIDTAGNIVIPSGSQLTITGKADGCATFSSGQLNSTGSACGGSGSTPGGADTNIQFNNAGSFGGSSGLVWNYTNNRLGIGTSTPYENLSVAGGAVFGFLNATTSTATSTIGGYLGVGTTTPWGNGLFTVGTSTPIAYIDKTSGNISFGTTNNVSNGALYKFAVKDRGAGTLATFSGTGNVSGATQVNIDADTTSVLNFSNLSTASSIQFNSSSLWSIGDGIYHNIFSRFTGIGTSTPFNLLTLATSTKPQLALSDGAGISQWTFRNAGGNLYFATTTTAGIATSTISAFSINANGGVTIPALPTGLTLSTSGALSAYAGTSCTNQFVRSLSASGVATCATVSSSDVSLANLTATNSTLTFSGTYDGSTARTIGLNLGNANTWTALQSFSANASTTGLSTGYAFFGTTATSSFSNIGALRIATSTSFLNSIATVVGTTTIHGNFATKMASTTAGTSMTGLLIDWSGATNASNGSNTYRITLTGNATIIMNATSSNPLDGGRYVVKFCQDNTGSRTVTWVTPGELRWASGTTTVSSTANTATHIGFIYDALEQRYTAVASTTGTPCKP